ncbi:type IV secretory system conjugative DNA transfer family protein [Enterococcus columbae]|uniref:TraD/TraG TraM recognition site domain-containing protein n=1 Tax=Enterococcus columbae DSM 7374 = ATCC 51263 TaxID=1121865 RepID=S1NEP1_9ENTE|nr:type IV secretory system conjugative DNA transfer family protein [Enterococcus columbae]EOT44579.1 hypothetical protein OMW_00635 [Enterococcus columbae DSM 7374 = ATCC 51263]EOW87525.1 hypothetical protein I568_00569 [Enterococcus columbae DSM 7374 = ATCC 51263]
MNEKILHDYQPILKKIDKVIAWFQNSRLHLETWRDPDKANFKQWSRYLGLRRFLLPLWLVSFIVVYGLLNYLIHIFEQVLHYFQQILTGNFTSSINWFSFSYFTNSTFVSAKVYWILYFILMLFVSIRFYIWRQSYKPIEEYLTDATSRWSLTHELDQQYEVMPTDCLDTFNGSSGIVIGTAKRTLKEKLTGHSREYLSTEMTNSLLVGETRSGKGIFGIEKAIDGLSRTNHMDKKQSMIIHDPSMELYLKWKLLLEERGYIVKLFNLIDTYYSDSINPLNLVTYYYRQYLLGDTENIRNHGLDQALAEMATLCFSYFDDENAREPFWQDCASALFTAATIALIEESLLIQQTKYITIYTVLNLIAEMNANRIDNENHECLKRIEKSLIERKRLFQKYKDKSVLDVYFLTLPEGHPARIAYQDILASAPAKVTIGNVVSHLLTKMKAFRRPGNAKLTAISTINYLDLAFGKQPMAIFIVVSDQDKSNHALCANFIDQSFKELHKVGLRTATRKLPRVVNYIDEEFGNMVRIPNQATKVTDGLKVGIKHYFVVQNFEQLKKYGEQDAETIRANCGNIICVKTKSKDTREAIQKDLGLRANLSLSRQGRHFDANKTFTESTERIALITDDELARLPFGRTVVIRSMKTHDLKGKVINPYPVYNRDACIMKPTYEYLPYREISWDDVMSLYDEAEHSQIELDHLLYLLDVKEIGLKNKRLANRRNGIKEDSFDKEESESSRSNQSPTDEVKSIQKGKRTGGRTSVIPTISNQLTTTLDKRFDKLFPTEYALQKVNQCVSELLCTKMKNIVYDHYKSEENREWQEFNALIQNSNVLSLKQWLGQVPPQKIYEQVLIGFEKEIQTVDHVFHQFFIHTNYQTRLIEFVGKKNIHVLYVYARNHYKNDFIHYELFEQKLNTQNIEKLQQFLATVPRISLYRDICEGLKQIMDKKVGVSHDGS